MVGDEGLSGIPAEKGQRGDVGPPGLPGKSLVLIRFDSCQLI